MLSRSLATTTGARRLARSAISANEVVDIHSVIVDEILQPCRYSHGLRAGIRDGPPKPNVIFDVIHPIGVGHQIVEVHFAHAKVTVLVPTIVWLGTFGHTSSS
jgi:hypothetical protein